MKLTRLLVHRPGRIYAGQSAGKHSFSQPYGPLVRGLALFMGGFCLLNLVGELRVAGFDANLWWIDFRSLSPAVRRVFLLVCSACLVAFAFDPPRSTWRRCLTAGCAGILAVRALVDAIVFYRLLLHKSLTSAFPFPFSFCIVGTLCLVIAACLRPDHSRFYSSSRRRPRRIVQAFAVCVVCLVLFPLVQMFCFGKSDYRRPADVAVVLGARVYADGHLSDALTDRVRTACALYQQGLVRKLLFSGGPGDGITHETEAMRRMAVALGVKPEDILLDPAGLNTQATVNNTVPLFKSLGAARVLVVSHFYHLPRIKLAYQRAGWDVFTVPARESYVLRQIPYNMAREIAALWVYYLRPLV